LSIFLRAQANAHGHLLATPRLKIPLPPFRKGEERLAEAFCKSPFEKVEIVAAGFSLAGTGWKACATKNPLKDG
jgi:hypothetical protein